MTYAHLQGVKAHFRLGEQYGGRPIVICGDGVHGNLVTRIESVVITDQIL